MPRVAFSTTESDDLHDSGGRDPSRGPLRAPRSIISHGSNTPSASRESASGDSSAPTSVTASDTATTLNFTDVMLIGSAGLQRHGRIHIPYIEHVSILLSRVERLAFDRVQDIIRAHLCLQAFVERYEDATLQRLTDDLLMLAVARTNHLWDEHTSLRDELTRYNKTVNRGCIENLGRQEMEDRLWKYAIFARDLKEFKVDF